MPRPRRARVGWRSCAPRWWRAWARWALTVVDGCAPFVLFTVPDAELMRKRLDAKGIAVRRCDTFVGLDGQFLRAAVRPDWRVLVDAVAEVLR